MINHDRTALRRQMADAWSNYRDGKPVDNLQAQIGRVVEQHPEYHALLAQPDAVESAFSPDDGQINPYLHLSLHIAIDDQLRTDRPPGVAALYDRLCRATGDAHAAQHVLLERLGETLWAASRSGSPPDTATYLRALEDDLGRLTGPRSRT